MNQESLKANDDENTEPARESGIFADLAVRKPTEIQGVVGRSVPPPPPRTRSSILPVARRPEEEPSVESPELEAVEAAQELDRAAQELDQDAEEPEFEAEDPEFDDDDDPVRPVQVDGPSTFMRPEPNLAATGRTVPPAPPRNSSTPTLPGMAMPVPAVRGSSFGPGVRPVSPAVAAAQATLPSASPMLAAPPAPAPSVPSVATAAGRDTSGTYQRVEGQRTSFAAAMQGPISVPAAQVALDHIDGPAPMYAPAPMVAAPSQVPYAVLIVGALIAACFAWYMFDTKAVPGVVQLTTAPADAVVLFDGAPVGSVSPFLKTGVVPGEKHTLEVKKPGFRTWAQEVEVQPGQTLVFTVALPSEAGDAPVAVPAPAVPAAAAAAPAALPEPAPAVAAVVAEPAAPAVEAPAPAPTPKAQSRRAAASAPVQRKERAVASPAPSGATGTLRVSSKPWSIITIDGKQFGNTPQMNLTLPEGTHRVNLMNPEFKIEKTVTVNIEPGKTETLIVNLL